MLKDHSCGKLRKDNIGEKVKLAGWVDRRRDHGGLIFIDLRDRDGIVQVVFNPAMSPESHQMATELRNEYVLSVSGEVAPRPAGTENTRLPTGEVEVIAERATILNTSRTPPFYINEETELDENLRLKYRYLDLRRKRMRDNILLRHQVIKFMRDFLDDRGFIEIETPEMIKSTPEGARDYLVPSRIYPGKFYALPQSPQQLKQLLMVAGFEKYYQIARCFRDEDTRADRQPEFTQLDIEMSWVDEDDILILLEELFTTLIQTIKPEMKMVTPFPRLKWAEAMDRFGSDKPDLRFGMEIADLSDIAGKSAFSIFNSTVAKGGRVKGICAPGCAGYTRSQLDELNHIVKDLGAGGLVTIALEGVPATDSLDSLTQERVKSVAAKYLSLDEVKTIARRLSARPGDLMLIVAGEGRLVNTVLGEVRRQMGSRLKLAAPDVLAFGFIVDFPLFEWNKKTNRWDSAHHPFTMPREEDIPILDVAPERVRSRSYDFICNGCEVSSGSIRIHKSELQRKIFHILGYNDSEIDERFGHLLEAFEYGAPPHGGIAPGIDRFVMLLAGEETIREVIAFPKNQNAVDVMLNAPERVSEGQLSELHIKVCDELANVQDS